MKNKDRPPPSGPCPLNPISVLSVFPLTFNIFLLWALWLGMWWSQDRHTGTNKSTHFPLSPHLTSKAPPYPTGPLSCIFERGDGWLHLSRSEGIFASVCGVFGGGGMQQCRSLGLSRLWGTATGVQREQRPPQPLSSGLLCPDDVSTCLP